MKIAFASCMSSTVFKQQPVWDQVAAHQPDRLVLLGDSVYIDAPPFPEGLHPKAAPPAAFSQHLLERWTALVNHPQFRAVATKVPTDAVWDDHDFLWDEHYGERAIQQRLFAEHVRTSRAMFNAFRRALDARLAADSFPGSISDAVLNKPDEPAPGYRHRSLQPLLKLHLTDGRSWRLGRDLLGAAQRAQIEAKLAAAPAAVHVIASGSVVQDNKDAMWRSFDDHAWLLAQARQYKLVVISGDIHRNRFQAIDVGGGRQLFDATSSGAAIKELVALGDSRQNHGLLTVDDSRLSFQFFSFGKPDPAVPARQVDRAAWRLV